jgi:hypothetical protein
MASRRYPSELQAADSRRLFLLFWQLATPVCRSGPARLPVCTTNSMSNICRVCMRTCRKLAPLQVVESGCGVADRRDRMEFMRRGAVSISKLICETKAPAQSARCNGAGGVPEFGNSFFFNAFSRLVTAHWLDCDILRFHPIRFSYAFAYMYTRA